MSDDSRAEKLFEYHHMIGAPHAFYIHSTTRRSRYILPNYGSVNSRTKMPRSETAGVGKIAGHSFPAR